MGVEPHTELVLLLRLVICRGLAAVLGWERESARKPAGLHTQQRPLTSRWAWSITY
jgi:uncharacterized membrane protein YhiD involved in acid resistance